MTSSDVPRPRILILEDELLIALDLDGQLGALGYEVVGPVARLAQAIALIDREPLDGAIIDVRLRADERSYEAADRLIARGIPFLFCTAYGEGEIDSAYDRRPVLRKPFTQASLAAALTRLLA